MESDEEQVKGCEDALGLESFYSLDRRVHGLKTIIGFGLSFNASAYSINWSENNLIAAGCGDRVIVISAGNLQGEQLVTRIPQRQDTLGSIEGIEKQTNEDSLSHKCRTVLSEVKHSIETKLLNKNVKGERVFLGLRQIQWSPEVNLAAFSCGVNSLLGVVTSDYNFLILAPPESAPTSLEKIDEQHIIFNLSESTHGIENKVKEHRVKRSRRTRTQEQNKSSTPESTSVVCCQWSFLPGKSESLLLLLGTTSPTRAINCVECKFVTITGDEGESLGETQLTSQAVFDEEDVITGIEVKEFPSNKLKHENQLLLLSCSLDCNVKIRVVNTVNWFSDMLCQITVPHSGLRMSCFSAWVDGHECSGDDFNVFCAVGVAEGTLAYFLGKIDVKKKEGCSCCETFSEFAAHSYCISGLHCHKFNNTYTIVSSSQEGNLKCWQLCDNGLQATSGLSSSRKIFKDQCMDNYLNGGYRVGLSGSKKGFLVASLRNHGQIENPHDKRYKQFQITVLEVFDLLNCFEGFDAKSWLQYDNAQGVTFSHFTLQDVYEAYYLCQLEVIKQVDQGDYTSALQVVEKQIYNYTKANLHDKSISEWSDEEMVQLKLATVVLRYLLKDLNPSLPKEDDMIFKLKNQIDCNELQILKYHSFNEFKIDANSLPGLDHVQEKRMLAKWIERHMDELNEPELIVQAKEYENEEVIRLACKVCDAPIIDRSDVGALEDIRNVVCQKGHTLPRCCYTLAVCDTSQSCFCVVCERRSNRLEQSEQKLPLCPVCGVFMYNYASKILLQ